MQICTRGKVSLITHTLFYCRILDLNSTHTLLVFDPYSTHSLFFFILLNGVLSGAAEIPSETALFFDVNFDAKVMNVKYVLTLVDGEIEVNVSIDR